MLSLGLMVYFVDSEFGSCIDWKVLAVIESHGSCDDTPSGQLTNKTEILCFTKYGWYILTSFFMLKTEL